MKFHRSPRTCRHHNAWRTRNPKHRFCAYCRQRYYLVNYANLRYRISPEEQLLGEIFEGRFTRIKKTSLKKVKRHKQLDKAREILKIDPEYE